MKKLFKLIVTEKSIKKPNKLLFETNIKLKKEDFIFLLNKKLKKINRKKNKIYILTLDKYINNNNLKDLIKIFNK